MLLSHTSKFSSIFLPERSREKKKKKTEAEKAVIGSIEHRRQGQIQSLCIAGDRYRNTELSNMQPDSNPVDSHEHSL